MIYLDNAATSFPKPQKVYERMNQFLREEAANPGRSGHRLSVQAEAQLGQARDVLAKLFNAPSPDRIIFTLNCTDSLNIAIKGTLRQGDHVITTCLEHNSVLRPLQALAQANVITLTHVQPERHDGWIDPELIERAFQKNTKLVAMTHASNVIGALEPIREIGKLVRNRDALFLVDAAQTAGAVSIDVQADLIDLLAFPGHKSLYGPPGTGGLFVGERARLTPWREGGTGFDSESSTQPIVLPFLLEGGTPNSVGIIGLKEGVNFILEQTITKIQAHERLLIQKLREGLGNIPQVQLFGTGNPVESVAPVSFIIKGTEPQEIAMILDETFQVAARAGLHCAPMTHQFIGTSPQGSIRFSPGFFNTIEDINEAVRAISEIQRQLSV